MRMWIALALLCVSWLLRQDYFVPAAAAAWGAAVLLGTLLLAGALDRLPPGRVVAWSAVLVLPAVLMLPWPAGVGPALVFVGLGLGTARAPRAWIGAVGRGAIAAGAVLSAQAVALSGYAAHTARSHDLPAPLVWLLAGVAKLLGADAAADGPYLAMHSMREVHRLAATWELLLDPATFCFYLGGLALLGLACWSRLPTGQRWPAWIAGLRRLTLVIALWLPIRAGLLIAVYLHRAARYEESLPLHVMNHVFSPWVLLALLAVPALLAWRFVRLPEPEDEGETAAEPTAAPTAWWRLPAAVGLVLVGVGLWTAAIQYDPVGTPKAGRVMVVERHSEWEPTTRPYDTTWYGHDAGYNYAAAYDYLGQYFEMSRLLESGAIDEKTLAGCDVLVIKTPTARYSRDEVDAVVRFVERGGGLLMVGDHTNYERGGTIMNDVARYFGFTFRDDLLFSLGDSPYRQAYRAPWAAHPAVGHVPPMDFAVSCSIDPGRSRGRAAIRNAGLFSLPPDYHIENFHTIPQHRPDMRFGSFVQLWSTRHGRGRVLAFTDSTIFSNFCIYQPGKAELLRGMVDWLNHGGPGVPRWLLVLLGAIPLGAGVGLARGTRGAWLLLLSAAACGIALAGQSIDAAAKTARPVPEAERPLPRVVIDRTTSAVPLGLGAYVEDESGQGYAMLEMTIPRLGCYTTRCSGAAAFSGDLLVIVCPTRSVSPEFRAGLARYVAGGGKLLVIDSPENDARSTADSLLWPFGLSIPRGQAWQGQLSLGDGWPPVAVERSYEVRGGKPVARLGGERPVAAVADHGEGRVMAVGFGSLLNDFRLANDQAVDSPWMAEPNEETQNRYGVLYALVGSLLFDEPIGKRSE